ncbi:hypothetical protein JF50_14700 [Pseudoalteromonas luteoviolacea]|uniref:Uncharacterized protein n=1 Tax=Pseudoalteromonas luteoviolacea TaxID=43657 RepID=A0A0C1Q835_9GAMM|nr:hypothetical protein JF50_14700 [Pseudoalteromonas luteoviolacea]
MKKYRHYVYRILVICGCCDVASEMFMTLNKLKELNSKNPQQAAQVFRSVRLRLPKKPSRGLLELLFGRIRVWRESQ